MADPNELSGMRDPHDQSRFLEAQEGKYERAIAEILGGRTHSTWMCYVFPQFEELGLSSTATRYAMKSLAEAKAYLNKPRTRSPFAQVRRRGIGHRGAIVARHVSLSRQHGTAILRDAHRGVLDSGFSVRPRARQVLQGQT